MNQRGFLANPIDSNHFCIRVAGGIPADRALVNETVYQQQYCRKRHGEQACLAVKIEVPVSIK